MSKNELRIKKEAEDYILGIDIGTTNVKACIINKRTLDCLASEHEETSAHVRVDGHDTWDEQDVHKIFTALQFCVSRLPRDARSHVKAVGVSGQMHGVVMWMKEGLSWRQKVGGGRYELDQVSSLYTWQDQRCDTTFLASLPQPESHLSVSSGYGCATLFWLRRHMPDVLRQYAVAGTVQDLLVAMLCNLQRGAVMSLQNAASWGYCHTVTGQWNLDVLDRHDFPTHLLPSIVRSGDVAGHMDKEWYDIPASTPVHVGLGDLQCSIIPHLTSSSHAVLTISTSAQLVHEMPPDYQPITSPAPIQYFPYFNHTYLAVAAALNGGNALQTFIDMLQMWTHQLGLGSIPTSTLRSKLEELGAAATSNGVDDMQILPTLLGERHLPEERGTVTGVTSHTLHLGTVYSALCRGVVSNIHSMMSREQLVGAGVDTLLISGGAILSSKLLQHQVSKIYNLPTQPVDGKKNAAYGAAVAVVKYGK